MCAYGIYFTPEDCDPAGECKMVNVCFFKLQAHTWHGVFRDKVCLRWLNGLISSRRSDDILQQDILHDSEKLVVTREMTQQGKEDRFRKM
jgi:hypothetical protein